MSRSHEITAIDAATEYQVVAELAQELAPADWAEMAGQFLAHPHYGPIFDSHADLVRLAGGMRTYTHALIDTYASDGGVSNTDQDETTVTKRTYRKQRQADNFERIDSDDVAPQQLGQALRITLRRSEQDKSIEIRPHQHIALHDIIRNLQEGKTEGIVNVATSGGKTYFIALLAAAAESIGYRTLIISPTKTISDQLIGVDGQRGLGRFTDMIERNVVSTHFDGNRSDKTARTVVSTYQSLNNFAANGTIGDFDLVLYDESHLSQGHATNHSLVTYSPHAIKIGFSATHGDTKNSFHSLPIREAIESGITAPVQSIIHKTGATIKILDPQIAALTTRELQQLSTLKTRNDHALEFTAALVAEGRQGIIACLPGANMAHPRFMAKELEKRQINAQSVGSHRTSEENAQILKDYEAGKIDVITFVKAIELGWDSKVASFLVNAGATTSMTRMAQLVGRIIRKKPDGLHSIVVDLVDNSTKRQVTAMDVIGERVISNSRIIGQRSVRTTRASHSGAYMRHLSNPVLYASLAEAEGMEIGDLYVKEIGIDAVEAGYNRILAQEGMPEEIGRAHLSEAFVTKAFMTAVDALLTKRAEHGGNRSSLPLRPDEISDYIIVNALVAKNKFRKLPDKVANLYMELTMDNYHIAAHNYMDPNTQNDQITDRIIDIQTTELIHQALDTISTREAEVLILRYGLNGQEPMVLTEVAQRLGVTRERIRQIEGKALSKMRFPERSKIFADLL